MKKKFLKNYDKGAFKILPHVFFVVIFECNLKRKVLGTKRKKGVLCLQFTYIRKQTFHLNAPHRDKSASHFEMCRFSYYWNILDITL